MSVTVLLFASLAEKAGVRRFETASHPGDTVQSIRDRVVAAFPALSPFVATLVYAVNETYARPDDAVAPGDTVALIPPVSGGS